MSDQDLVARALAGDPAAERALYDTHVDRVFRLVHRLAGDAELARDLTQEAFIRAFRRLGDFRGEAAFGTWLHRIAVTTALNALRGVRRHRAHETAMPDADALPQAPGRPSDPVLRHRLTVAIDALPEIYRTVFLMFDLEGYTHEEIASTLGIPAGTSKARLSHARARLREALADVAGEWVS